MERFDDVYNYDALVKGISYLKSRFNFLEVDHIGYSILGRKLHLLKLGNGDTRLSINASHHSLEWITSVVLMKFVEEICDSLSEPNSDNIFDINKYSLYFIPMVNPDGIELVKQNSTKYYNWQANFRGVDINHNYDAGFEEYKVIEKSIGIDGPGPTRYSGLSPESEPETQAMISCTNYYNFERVMALHSQGEEIFYSFNSLVPSGALELAEKMAQVSGYQLSQPSPIASYGGYKDWFIQKFNRTGYTIEIGKGQNSLPIEQLPEIYPKVARLMYEFIANK